MGRSHLILSATLTVCESARKSRNNRSVMPLDVLGRTRATLTRRASCYLGRGNESCNTCCNGDRILQLLFVNEEFLVIACHQRAMNPVPFFCTHRLSQFLIVGSGKYVGDCGEVRTTLRAKTRAPNPIEET